MATTRTFNDMLNEYLPNELLMEELIRRDYILQQVTKDESWKGGDLIVPFRGAQASSVKWGGLTASNDIAESAYVRGKIEDYKEVWGSLIFNQADLMQHDGKIPDSTFLRVLPDEIDNFMNYFKEVVSIQLGTGPHFAVVTDATNAATGIMVVDRIDRFSIGQKVVLDDGDSPQGTYYVTAVNVNTNAVTLSATRGGGAADVSAFSVAQSAKFYHEGVWDGSTSSAFISMRSALLSAANGGSTTIHGQTKTAYPYLQSVNVDGSAITSSNLVESLFDAYVSVRNKARGQADTFLMSYTNWASVMKSQQIEKGAYKVVNDVKRSEFGWWETMIASTTRGEALKIVGIQEMDDDIIPIVDWKSMKFRSNGGFRKRVSPDGRQYFEVRNTSGYQYIVDVCLFGEMEFTKPGNNGIIYGIDY